MKHAKLTIKALPLKILKPHPRNPRKHPAPGSEEWETLKRSLADNYWDPLVFNFRNNFLISGHLRAKVLSEMGVAKADCVVVDFDEDKHVQIMLRANTNSADWDDAALANILKDMTADQALMAGFSAADIAGLETDAGAVMKKSEPADNENEQHLQELVAKWKTAPDQLWQIGPHRLRIGSATDPIAWTELMQGQRANLVYCDPPYGVSYHSAKSGEIQNDDLRRNALTQLLKPAFEQMVQHAEDNAAFYIWHASSTRRDFEWALDQAALEEAQYLTWVKDSFVMGRADYHWATEPAFYCQKAAQDIARDLDSSLPTMEATDLAELLQPEAPTKTPPGQQIGLPPDPTHRRRVSRRMFYDFSQVANATRLIKQLPAEEETIHCVMDGTFNGIALVPAVLELHGRPVNRLTITTLGFNLRNIECLIELYHRGQIKAVQMVCSEYFEKASAPEYLQAKSRFDSINATLKASLNHSKILLFEFDDADFVVESSANLRSCNNIECFQLTRSSPLLQFHLGWITKML